MLESEFFGENRSFIFASSFLSQAKKEQFLYKDYGKANSQIIT